MPEEAVPEAEAPAEQPTSDLPPQTGEGEVDISTLPAPVQEYIKELREEARDRRKAHEPFKQVFDQYNARETELLLGMVNDLAVDQTKGATVMLNFAKQLLGDNVTAEEVQAVTEAVEEEAEEKGLTPEQVQQMIREQTEQEKMIARVHDETRKLGFDPQSEQAHKLWDMAISLQEEDLSKVAPLVHQYFGTQPETEEEPEPEPEPKPAGRFPATAGRGGSGETGLPEEPATPPPVKSDQMRARVMERLRASAGE